MATWCIGVQGWEKTLNCRIVKALLLKWQKGKCTHCGLSFHEWDVLEVDHIIPRALRGKDEYRNLQLLHRHCHDEKTKDDLIEIRKKETSNFFDRINKILDKYDWGWINDIPVMFGDKKDMVRSPLMTTETH